MRPCAHCCLPAPAHPSPPPPSLPPAVYRSAFAEDIDEVGERRLAQEGGFRELRLQRLA